VRPLEDRVVVELGVARQADGPPVLLQRRHDAGGGDRGGPRPGGDQAAVQGHAVEHLDPQAALQRQPLDDVEAVQLGLPGRHRGEVPTGRRRRAAGAAATVEGTAAGEDPVHGPQRRQRADAAPVQRLPDGRRPAGAEVAVGQLPAQPQDQVLDAGGGAPRAPRCPGPVLPIDAVEAAVAGAPDPVGDGGDADAEAVCNGAQRIATTDGSDDLAAAVGTAVC
jgi:hypothetical protein